MRVTVYNRGPDTAPIHLLPTLWFRNTWVFGDDTDGVPNYQPTLVLLSDGTVSVEDSALGHYVLHADGKPEWLFCDNETNLTRLYDTHTGSPYPKDGINDYLIHSADTVNPNHTGTKAAAHYMLTVDAGQSVTLRLRLENKEVTNPFADFESIFAKRKAEADEFYQIIQPKQATDDEKTGTAASLCWYALEQAILLLRCVAVAGGRWAIATSPNG